MLNFHSMRPISQCLCETVGQDSDKAADVSMVEDDGGGASPPAWFTLRKGDVFGELALFPDLLERVWGNRELVW